MEQVDLGLNATLHPQWKPHPSGGRRFCQRDLIRDEAPAVDYTRSGQFIGAHSPQA